MQESSTTVATNRRLSAVVVVPRREVAERCVNTPVDQQVSWNGDAKTSSTGLGTDPSGLAEATEASGGTGSADSQKTH